MAVQVYLNALRVFIPVQNKESELNVISYSLEPMVNMCMYVFCPPAQVCPMGLMQTCSLFPSRGRPLLLLPTMQGPGEQVRLNHNTFSQTPYWMIAHVLPKCHNFFFSFTPSILFRRISEPEPSHLTKPQPSGNRYRFLIVPGHTIACGVPRHGWLPD